MSRLAICTVILFGFSHFAMAQTTGQGTNEKTSHQESRSLGNSSDHHIPSAGITLETLKSFPFPYNHYYNNTPVYQTWNYYQPAMYGSFGYPRYSYGYRPFGMGGFRPQGVGGYYRANIGFLLPLW